MGSLDKEIRDLRKIVGRAPEKVVLEKTHEIIKKRIFEEGLDSNDQPIGTYSNAYLKKRQQAGLGGDPKVIVTFTGQTKDEFVLTDSPEGFKSGFQGFAGALRAQWVENTYDKKIFDVTEDEEAFIEVSLQNIIDKIVR